MTQPKQLLRRRDPSDPAYVLIRSELVTARKAAGLSQQALADNLGRPQSFIAKIERGERFLDLVEFVLIAKYLKIDVTRILKALSE